MNDSKPMSCEEALQLLVLQLDGELAPEAGDSLDEHLARCRSCYSRAEFERRLKAEVARLRRDDIPSAFEERIRRLLQTFTPASAGQPADGIR